MKVNALFSALVSILLLSGTAAHAQGLSREQAAQALSKADTQMRRDAVSRLGEVGTMADATAVVSRLSTNVTPGKCPKIDVICSVALITTGMPQHKASAIGMPNASKSDSSTNTLACL